MKKNLTEMVFVLDKSGSMSGLELDTIGGLNSLIKKQKSTDGECVVTTVLFDSKYEILHDRLKLEDVPNMKECDYIPSGCTALVDTLGEMIKHINNIHKYIREDDLPEHTVVVVMTDGMENASHKYNLKQVKKEIENCKEKGWEFLFLGANIDAISTASDFGIDENRAVNYHADKKGTKVAYQAVGDAMCELRCAHKLDENWKTSICEDFESR